MVAFLADRPSCVEGGGEGVYLCAQNAIYDAEQESFADVLDLAIENQAKKRDIVSRPPAVGENAGTEQLMRQVSDVTQMLMPVSLPVIAPVFTQNAAPYRKPYEQEDRVQSIQA